MKHAARLTVIFVLAFIALAVGSDRSVGVYDEGVILVGAMRVARGELPHADFYANYGPAQFYVVAALFKVFGELAIVERVYDLLVRAAIVTVFYCLLEAAARRWLALGFSILCGAWLFSVPFYGYPMFPVMLLSLVGVAVLTPALAGRSDSLRLFGAGSVVGLAALFRYDVGFFLFATFGALLVASVLLRPANHRGSLRNAWGVLPFVSGTATVFTPIAVLYLVQAPVGPFIHDVIVYPINNYARMRGLPFPGLHEVYWSKSLLGIYVPLVTCGVAVLAFLFRNSQPKFPFPASKDGESAERYRNWLTVVLGSLAAVMYLKGLVRVSVLHMLASLIPSLLLLGVLFDRALSGRRWERVVWGAVCLLAATGAITASREAARSRFGDSSSGGDEAHVGAQVPDLPSWLRCDPNVSLPKIQCLRLDADRIEAAKFVVANTGPDDRIFVGLTRHDRVFANDNIMYFAVGRLPATRWSHFDPGLQNREDVQKHMIGELREHNVRVLILESHWEDVREQNGSAVSSGVNLLDEYVRSHYHRVREHGRVSVWLREGA